VYDHNLAALDAYRSRHYPASILLIRCTEPTDTVMEPDYGWSRFVEGVETFELDATHGTLLANPHARDVAGFLAKWVDDLSLSRRRVDENDLVAVDVAAHGLRRGRRQTA
jgi:thioesterase domain-containing protein